MASAPSKAPANGVSSQSVPKIARASEPSEVSRAISGLRVEIASGREMLAASITR